MTEYELYRYGFYDDGRVKWDLWLDYFNEKFEKKKQADIDIKQIEREVMRNEH